MRMEALTTTEIENRMKENQLDPFWKFQLQVDAYRIASRYLFDPISVVAIGKIDPLPHQVEAFLKMMAMLRPSTGIEGRIRMLLADDVGLGKTIMIGLVLKELLLRKKISRVLIICPSGLQIQWKEEMRDKFNEDFTIIKGPIDGNPYEECEKVIVSVDIGRNEEKTSMLLGCEWDLVIFDEAHRLKPGSLRYEQVGKPMAEKARHLILASATPHDGKVENFLALIQLIDQDIEPYTESGDLRRYLEPKMIRRLKEEIVDFRGKKIFPQRDSPQTVEIEYSPEEREFYDMVEDYVRRYYRSAEEASNYNVMLALYILHRRVSSSLAAGVRSLENRKIRLVQPFFEGDLVREYSQYADEGDEQEREKIEEKILGATSSITSDELREELALLDNIIGKGRTLISEEKDQKYNRLIALIREMRGERPEDKVIIFTEFTDTLRFLQNKLTAEGFLIAKIKGGMEPEEKKRESLLFENNADILLGTEAAGEGLNLQFANIVINYELPWNPNRLEQRIGRVYRYGQKKRVYIHNFKTAFPIDDAVLSKILEKMEQIRLIFQDRAIDVIGSLISERDVMEIFRLSRTGTTAVDKVDQLFAEKLEVFKVIEKFLVKQQFNLVNVKNLSRDLNSCIYNFDIERFFLTFAEHSPGVEIGSSTAGVYPIHIKARSSITEIPCLNWHTESYREMFVQGVFDPSKKGTYVSLGHPIISAAIDECLASSPIVGIPSEKRGVILTYTVRVCDGLGREIYTEPLLLKKTDDSTEILNPLEVWNIHSELDYHLGALDTAYYSQIVRETDETKDIAMNEHISSIKKFSQEKHDRDLETEFEYAWAELDWKIKQETRKKSIYLEKGMNWLIQACNANIAHYREEYRKIIKWKDEAKKEYSVNICGPINILVLVPIDKTQERGELSLEQRIALEKRKKEIELKGMRAVEQYEKIHGRNPIDVSLETVRGYDILSSSTHERRLIEVKSFAASGKVEISSNEWRTSSLEREDYYLYIVENTDSIPQITIIRDPYLSISEYVEKKKVEDYRMILYQLPENIQYLERAIPIHLE